MSANWAIHRAPSSIHGEGAFAGRPIERGAPVLACSGLRLRGDELQEGCRAMQIGPDEFLVEDRDRPQVDDFLNHGCEPNLGFLDGGLVLYALRGIRQGEELLFDYSTAMNQPGWSFPCGCGASACRRVVQSYCDLDPRVRLRLRSIALSYLRSF